MGKECCEMRLEKQSWEIMKSFVGHMRILDFKGKKKLCQAGVWHDLIYIF